MDDEIQASPPRTSSPITTLLRGRSVFSCVEHGAYVVVGVLLSITAVLALAGAATALWTGLHDWAGTQTIATIIERLLFVLMLVEILHTVRASMRSGGLSPEPFLIVGLIACIRRILVVTLESTETTRAAADATNAEHGEAVFRATMIELGVLGFLILVMVVSIYMLRRARAEPDQA